jgi:uncharacterized protein (DUF2141 family)
MSPFSCITISRRLFLPFVLLPLLLAHPILSIAAQKEKTPPERTAVPGRVRLTVTVTSIRNDNGHIAASLFNGEKGFPGDDMRAVGHQISPINDRKATVVFDDLSPGSYGVALLHDENRNHKMDSNRFGFPREGYGISNNPRPTRRGPKYGDARFVVTPDSKEQRIVVKIVYLRLGDILR